MTPDAAMRRAVELAERARGRTAPNPIVGCVILRGYQVVGEGWHAGAGRAHAERVALDAAGDRARGATLVCTLEPCSHHGRTPPCCEAIVAAGVARVECAVLDPDPRVAGRGVEGLRAAGVEVSVGLGGDDVSWQLRSYLHHRRTGRPWITAKWAMTLDGKLATTTGDSRWVTGERARAEVHRMRDETDAVLVGVGTLLVDDPALTCRTPSPREPRQPTRIIVDTHGRAPHSARAFVDGAAPTILACSIERHVHAPPGVEVLRLPEEQGRVSLPALTAMLGELGLVDVLCEAGGTLTGALLRAGLVSEVAAFIAPKLAGGGGPTPWDGPGPERMAEALPLARVTMTQVGDDWLLRGLLEPRD